MRGRLSTKMMFFGDKQHVHLLAARRLLEKPGLSTVLNALSFYRQKRLNQIGWHPKHAYDLAKDQAWLR